MDVLYDKIDQLSYPTRIEFYYNGDITSTLSTTRFISYDDQNYLIGISPNGKSPLIGRVFYLMVGFSTSSLYRYLDIISLQRRWKQFIMETK